MMRSAAARLLVAISLAVVGAGTAFVAGEAGAVLRQPPHDSNTGPVSRNAPPPAAQATERATEQTAVPRPAVVADRPAAGSPLGARRPALVVLLVVDQFRADYVDRYGHMWTGGLRRLLGEGAYFRRAAFPYLSTFTCVGHATISTGALPPTHGIVGNGWYDRESAASIGCADDSRETVVSYAQPVKGGYSTARLLVPTLADELRAQLPGATRVVTMSMKERTAIMMAGRRGDAVTWFNTSARGFVTSSAYTKGPVPFVEAFLKANPIEREFGTAWTRALPATQYLFGDAADGEQPPSGWTTAFPHALGKPPAKPGDAPGSDFYSAWEESPMSDTYLGRLAEASVDALKLGRGPGTDFLAVSFSALDLVGHDFGPRSHEVQDTLVRVDRTIGRLLAHLDRTVGAGRYVVALTGDHGASPIPEQLPAFGFEARRIPMAPIVAKAEEVLGRALGPGKHVIRMSNSDLYLAPGVAARLREMPAARADLVAALGALPGIARVLFADDFAGRRPADDPDALAAAMSTFPGRSGDIVLVPRPYGFYVSGDGSKMSGAATTHGTSSMYDRAVPLVFWGAGVKPGRFLRAVTPADIAPTLAYLCGVTLARPDGEVLGEAVR